MNDEDVLSFRRDLEPYIKELSSDELEKSGIDFDRHCDWETLCYAAFWYMSSRNIILPEKITNRMVLGEKNIFVGLYLRMSKYFRGV